jgi:hypothetical protein
VRRVKRKGHSPELRTHQRSVARGARLNSFAASGYDPLQSLFKARDSGCFFVRFLPPDHSNAVLAFEPAFQKKQVTRCRDPACQPLMAFYDAAGHLVRIVPPLGSVEFAFLTVKIIHRGSFAVWARSRK